MSGRLPGKVAIVTGGGSGFGAAIATRFAAEGARVVIADIDEKAAQAVARSIGDVAHATTVDVSQAGGVQDMADVALDQFGRVDVLVNNAGTTHKPMPADEVDDAMFDRLIAVNLKSIYYGVRTILPVFRRLGGGVILNIGSVGGLRPRPGLVWYGASKGAVSNATRGLAVELAPLGIRVNNIAPSAGETPLLSSFVADAPGRDLEHLVSTIPLGRLAMPLDVANAAVFLASDEAAFVTGIDLCVDGGRHI